VRDQPSPPRGASHTVPPSARVVTALVPPRPSTSVPGADVPSPCRSYLSVSATGDAPAACLPRFACFAHARMPGLLPSGPRPAPAGLIDFRSSKHVQTGTERFRVPPSRQTQPPPFPPWALDLYERTGTSRCACRSTVAKTSHWLRPLIWGGRSLPRVPPSLSPWSRPHLPERRRGAPPCSLFR